MKNKLLLSLVILLMTNFTYAQFESANITAYFTEDFQSIDSDSTKSLRKIEIRIDNLDSLAVHGFIVEVLQADSEYIMSRVIGNKYKKGTMASVSYEKDSYFIDAGYFNSDDKFEILIRLEDYKKGLSDLFTLTVQPYDR